MHMVHFNHMKGHFFSATTMSPCLQLIGVALAHPLRLSVAQEEWLVAASALEAEAVVGG